MPLAPFSRRGLVFMFGSENIFFAPLKIMTNQKSPAHFWARFSGHVPLVMKSSAKDAGQSFAPIYVVDRPCPEKHAQKYAGDFSVPYIAIFAALFWTMLYVCMYMYVCMLM